MSTPNTALRAARMGMLMSQDDLAQAMREVGCVTVTKRLIQRYESGKISRPGPRYARALQHVMGLPIDSLGFAPVVMATVRDDGHGGHDVVDDPDDADASIIGVAATVSSRWARSGHMSGIWLSRYEYYSSGRAESHDSAHHVVVLQHGTNVTMRSLPASAGSDLSLTLDIDGSVATGIWREATDPTGYYHGAVYHGAIQLRLEPTGHRMTGKWIGFGSTNDVNSGPWEFTLLDASTSKPALARYNHPPDAV